MDEKVIVITGAGSGLGAAMARKYAAEGHHICLIGRTREKLKETAATLTTDNYTICPLDVTVKRDVEAMFQSIKEEVGPADMLINNAGVGVFDTAENLDENAVHQMIDINLKGTIFCTQAVLKIMMKRNAGVIANVISTAGLEGKATETVYCASKFGVRGFTESLLAELKDTDIHVFSAYMGGMKTPFWDGIIEEENMEHMMDPEDIADVIMHNIKVRKNINVDHVVIKNH